MSQRKKGGKSGSMAPASVLLPAGGPSLAEIEERQRDEMDALAAIYGDDYTVVSAEAGKPLHFQIRVRPLPNEDDASNHCMVLLDVMLTASPLPLLVVRKAKGLGESVLESLQTAVNSEAGRLVAKGDESIIYPLVCFIAEYLLPYNVAPKSFHEMMIEREAKQEQAKQSQQQQQQNQQQSIRQEEQEWLKRSIEAANRKKEEALMKIQHQSPAHTAFGATPASSLSRSLSASPFSSATSPQYLSSSPPYLPNLHLGASALGLNGNSAFPPRSSSLSKPSTPGPALSIQPDLHPHTGRKKSASVNIGPAKTVGTKGGGAATKKEKDKEKDNLVANKKAQAKMKKELDKKKKGKHKPRQLRETASDSESSRASGLHGLSSSDEDDDEDEDGSDTGSSDWSDVEDSGSLSEGDEESLFVSPGTSLTDGIGAKGAVSSLDKLMREIELKDAAAARKQKHKSGRGRIHSDSEDSELLEEDEEEDEEEEDEEEDDEEESDDDDIGQSPTAAAAAGRAWLEQSGATPAQPALRPSSSGSQPHYSRFRQDFEQLEMLGKGGFGEVYKVRNKVDKLFYAVKRIKLKRRNPAMNRKIIKEVSFIAMLHHKYIVRYFQAWIEGDDSAVSESVSIKTPADVKKALAKASAAATAATAGAAPTATATAKRSAHRHHHDSEDDEDDDDDDEEDWLKSSRPSLGRSLRDDDDDDDSDEDESEEDDEESDSDSDSDSSSSQPREDKAGQQYLYIQMEYCPNKTLRDIIDEHVFDQHPDECWRLFRQLLEAVAYIHKKGILHRDLKPPNVFISTSDSANMNVKLGDFGLAVLSSRKGGSGGGGGGAGANPQAPPPPGPAPSSFAPPPTHLGLVHSHSSDLENSALSRQDSIDECVGTHFYSAPEQRTGSKYDFRVDLFSLGIIFFEMLYPFGSLMERALQLEELRATGKVPNEFLVGRADRTNAILIIESLLKHNPEERPTAEELLKSGLIPLKLEDEYMEMALQSVASRDSVHHTRLLDILFAMPPEPTIDFTFDYLSVSGRGGRAGAGGGRGELQRSLLETLQLQSHSSSSSLSSLKDPPLQFHSLCQMKVFDTFSHLFRNHGAIHLSPPIITPKSLVGTADSKTNAAIYLDPQGTLIKLPYTLTVPFARYIAQQSTWTWSGAASRMMRGEMGHGHADSLEEDSLHFDLRRYEINKVYRKNIIGGRPKEVFECDFDIVWSNPFANTGAAFMNYPPPSASSSSSARDARAFAREKLACLSGELVKVSYDALNEFVPMIGTPILIKLNHADLFQAVLDVVLAEPVATAHKKGKSNGTDTLGTSPPKGGRGYAALTPAAIAAKRVEQAALRKDLCKLANNFALFQGTWSKSPMRRQLIREKKLSPKKVDLLGALFQLHSEPGKPEAIFSRVRDTLFSTPEARMVLSESAIIDHLDFLHSVFTYLRLFHVDSHVVFDLSICGKQDLYQGGIVFQALVPNGEGGGAAGVGGGGGNGVERGMPSDLPLSTSTSASSSSSRSDSLMQYGYDTLALGGQYDSLVASFMPPTSSMPLSALGVNFAIEKIVNAVAFFQLRASSKMQAFAASNPVLQRRVKKSLYGGDLHSSSILLFSSRNIMLKERASLAHDLWTDNLPCLYLHPPHLNYSNLKLFVKEMMIRWVVIFRRQEFKENGQVQVVDCSAPSARWDGKQGSKEGGETVVWMAASDVPQFIRSKMAGKKAEGESGGGGGGMGSSSHHHSYSSSGSYHAHSNSKSTPFHLHLIDAQHMKAASKNQVQTHVKRCLSSIVQGAHPSTYAVCGVDLPLSLIRTLTSAFYQGQAAVQAVIEDCHARQRGTCDQLVAYMVKKNGGQHMDYLPPSTNSKAKDKQASTVDTSKEKVEVLYIYSIPDKKADMLLYN